MLYLWLIWAGSVLFLLVQKVQMSRYAIYRAFENLENI
nr:MAG TPA: hypothetical protein [Caudoviricetes sp.]